jgi:hypothetical protein
MKRTEKRKANSIMQVYQRLYDEIDQKIGVLTLDECIDIPDEIKDLIEANNSEYNRLAENYNRKNIDKMKYNSIRNESYDEIRRVGKNIYYDVVCELLFEKHNIQLFQAAREYEFITEMYGKISVPTAVIKAYSKIINKN